MKKAKKEKLAFGNREFFKEGEDLKMDAETGKGKPKCIEQRRNLEFCSVSYAAGHFNEKKRALQLLPVGKKDLVPKVA